MPDARLEITVATTRLGHVVGSSLEAPAETYGMLRGLSAVKLFDKASDVHLLKNRLLGFPAEQAAEDLSDIAELIRSDPQVPARITVGDVAEQGFRLRTENAFTHRVHRALMDLVRDRLERILAVFADAGEPPEPTTGSPSPRGEKRRKP